MAGPQAFWNRVVDYIIQGWLWICQRKEVGYKVGHMSDGINGGAELTERKGTGLKGRILD